MQQDQQGHRKTVDNDRIVYLEFCENCSSHAWCTRHVESHYSNKAVECKIEILIASAEGDY